MRFSSFHKSQPHKPHCDLVGELFGDRVGNHAADHVRDPAGELGGNRVGDQAVRSSRG